MGLFSVPFRPAEGPLADHVLKPYRSGRDLELLEPLARRHTVYLECLQRAGLVVPETELVLLDDHGVLRPVIVQEAVPASPSVGCPGRVRNGRRRCAAWNRSRRRSAGSGRASPRGRSGSGCMPRCTISHRRRRGVLFLDTFPPLIGYSREDMGRLLLRFSESGLMRGIGALLPGRVREIQDPWYSLPGNLNLLIEGSLRCARKTGPRSWDGPRPSPGDVLSQPGRRALMQALSRSRPNASHGTSMRRLGAGLRPNA
jgi:hypothetical protein